MTTTPPATGGKRTPAKKTTAKGNGNGDKDTATEAVAAEAADQREAHIAERAATIRERHKYDGTLTPKLLLDLEPLLRERMDPKYIVTTPSMPGKPYESTGLKSVQPQVDRMNAVLGGAHWRALYHYEDGGKVCKTVVIVGNDLRWARLDERGNLLAHTDTSDGSMAADVLVERAGWGGHSRGSNRGDLHKGSETNALKRCLARVGPGNHVYALDFDEDPTAPEYRDTPAPAAQPQQQATPAGDPVDYDASLDSLLGTEDELQAKRCQADEGMKILGAPVKQRFSELDKCKTEKDLDGLIARVNAAIDGQPELA